MNKEEIIKQLKALLPCEQFVVTGSYALQQMGLVTKAMGAVGDIDIILVNPTEESVNILTRLQSEFPAKTKFEYEKKGFIFVQDGVKIDVFIESVKEETELMFNGILLAKVDHIINAKKSYNRMKDWIQLRKISRLFFKEEEFTTFLNNQ